MCQLSTATSDPKAIVNLLKRGRSMDRHSAASGHWTGSRTTRTANYPGPLKGPFVRPLVRARICASSVEYRKLTTERVLVRHPP